MKAINTLLIACAILVFAIFTINSTPLSPLSPTEWSLGSLLTVLVSIVTLGMFRTNIKISGYIPDRINFNKYGEIPLDIFKNSQLLPINWKSLIPFLPLIFMAILLLAKPYYLFPTPGDLDFHLMRAREIIENPLYGLFYDYMINYPLGRPVGHPPLFHSVLASLWYLGGVRFAHSTLCITQILGSIGIATWFANKKYGIIAGFFAGLLVFSVPRPDTLFVAMPATFIPILGVMTIYFLPESGKKALMASLVGIWTHMIGIVIFPLLFISNKKGREYLKNWKISLLLFSSVLFWLAYWTYFTGQPCPNPLPSISLYNKTYLPGLILLLAGGVGGMVILLLEKKMEFRLFLIYLVTVLSLQWYIGDISRGFQYAALPLTILSGLFIQRTYEHLSLHKTPLKKIFVVMMLFIAIISGINLVDSPLIWVSDWSQADTPFENKYQGLKEYIDTNTDKNQVLSADTPMIYKIAWMTGRNVFNEEFGTVQGLNSRNDLNVYEYPDHFSINDKNNISKKEIWFQ